MAGPGPPVPVSAPEAAAHRPLERAGALIELGEPERACATASTVYDVGHHYQSEALVRDIVALRATVTATWREVDNLGARLAGMY